MVPGEKFSTTTSAQRSRGSINSRLSGRFISSATLCLELFKCAQPRFVIQKLPALEAATLNVNARQAGPGAAFNLDDLCTR